MKKDVQKIFARRVSQANRTELLVITYDMLIEEIDEAVSFLRMEDEVGFRREIKLAQRYLAELMRTLDFSYKVSGQLLALYEYVQRVLIRCDVTGTDEDIKSARRVISRLREAYAAIGVTDRSEPVMLNAQTVFAGLTYGKGTLNELSLDPDTCARGYLA